MAEQHDNSVALSPTSSGLRQSCLSYVEVLAQSVAVIAPSTVPAAVIGLIFASAGNGTWLSFLLGMLGLVLVSSNINQFARRSASPASLYSYVVQGLGPTAGVLAGWALMFGYMLTGMSTLCGFAIIGNLLLQQTFGIELNPIVLFTIGAIGSWYVAFRDIQLSAKMMLIFEGAAILMVLALGAMVWASKGFILDQAQVTFQGATPGGILVGVVLVIFGFSGFESSTSLGEEAKDPLRTIPRSVIQSVVVTGLFFIVMAYIVVLGFQGSADDLAKTEAPFSVLSAAIGRPWLGTIINVGILLSFFSCTLASISATAHILFAMAHHGLVGEALGEAHAENETPHIAVALCALLTFLVPAVGYLFGLTPFVGQGDFGSLCSFGFITVYVLISIAAPAYLKTIGKLTKRALAFSIAAVAFMALPIIADIGIPGSTLFPPPDFANAILLVLFAVYMALGLAWLAIRRVRRPKLVSQMRDAIDAVDAKFAYAREQAS